MREQVFRQMVARETGTPVSASAVAAAARRLCEHFAERLTPMIGDAGVAAICARSIHLSEVHGRERASVVATQDDSPFAHLQRFLEQQEPAAATEAAVTILVTTSELLGSFIGADLTASLLREAWPEDFAAGTEET